MTRDEDQAWQQLTDQLKDQGTPEPLHPGWRGALVLVWLLALAPGALLLAAAWSWLVNQ